MRGMLKTADLPLAEIAARFGVARSTLTARFSDLPLEYEIPYVNRLRAFRNNCSDILMNMNRQRYFFGVATTFFLGVLGKALPGARAGVKELAGHTLTGPQEDWKQSWWR